MMKYAIIKNKKVDNIIEADQSFIDVHFSGAVPVDGFDVGIGDAFNVSTKKFTRPAQPKQAQVVQTQIITKIAFMSLFTDAELIAIYDAAKLSTAVHVWIKKLEASTDVKLSSQTTIAGVKALEKAGLIATGRAAVILK